MKHASEIQVLPTLPAPREYACALCCDTGWLERDNGTLSPEYVKCACRTKREQRQMIERFMSASGLTEDMGRYSFSAFEERGGDMPKSPAAALIIAHDFASGLLETPWLMLYGSYGSGKTHLAVAVVKYRIEVKSKAAIFGTVPDLIDRLRSGYRDGTYDEMIRALQDVDLLVLDDFGIGKSNSDSNEYRLLFQVLNARSLKRLDTIITSNMTPQKIEPRLRSRIMDTQLCRRVEIAGDDARMYR